MDKLMAELMAGKTSSPKQSAVRNHQKPGTDKVSAVQSSAEQGVKTNTMKPDFNKNTVLRSMSLLTDNTAFNIEPPSQILSPTAGDSFLGQKFNSKMIITGQQPSVVAGASRINEADGQPKTGKDLLGVQNSIAPPAFDDVSAILRSVDEESINAGAYRRKPVQ